jgi:hypothetical protein
MINSDQQARVCRLYSDYCGVIKPLIAEIEARSEKIPIPIFNEIRAFNDHIARCYYNDPSEEYIDKQIEKAERHITRIMLDCFKCLNVILYQRIELFNRQTRNVDLTVINNGTFFTAYSTKCVSAAKTIEEAKKTEAINTDDALELYQAAYNDYAEVVALIIEVSESVKWARVRFSLKKWGSVIGWIVSVVVSAIVSAYFSCELIAKFMS